MKGFIPLFIICALLFVLCSAREGSHEGLAHEKETKHMAVELSSLADPDVVAKAHGFVNLGPVGSLQNVYLFEEDSDLQKRVVINTPHISESPHVTWFEKQVARKRLVRAVPTDPLFAQQWHLHQANGVDVNVLPVWERSITGSGVVIAMVDDGLQYTHPDISPGYVAAASYDFNQGDADPAPHSGDDHGTSAGGVAAARNDNNVCGCGSAPHANISGIRLIADYTTDAQEAQGLTYMSEINDIYSNSWGPSDDGRRLEGPGRLTLAAMEQATVTGRDGKGTVYVWAGGNGNNAGDNCNYDGYANSRFTISIGAVDWTGRQSYYSERCADLIACAPSSGGSPAKSVVTTDLLGYSGTSSTDCTGSFGGTSAAAPLVAGVVALILQANPNLGWRDVQHILANTSRITDATDGDWFTNVAGFHHNHKYGFGLIDADAAVTMATSSYTNLGEYRSFASPVVEVLQPIEDRLVVESTNVVTDTFTVESVEVVLNVEHSFRGNLYITLVSPSGTISILQEPHNDRNANINWMYSTVRSWGESSKGTWVLRVEDRVSGYTGKWISWQLNVWGH